MITVVDCRMKRTVMTKVCPAHWLIGILVF